MRAASGPAIPGRPAMWVEAATGSAEAGTEVLGVVQETPHRVLGFAEPFHVSEITACFDRHDEVSGRALCPSGERVWLGEPVEGVVRLHGGELSRIVFEPARLRQLLRVETATPVAI